MHSSAKRVFCGFDSRLSLLVCMVIIGSSPNRPYLMRMKCYGSIGAFQASRLGSIPDLRMAFEPLFSSLCMETVAEKIPEYLVIGIEEFYEDYNSDVIIVAIKDKRIRVAMLGYCSCDGLYDETPDSLRNAFQIFSGDIEDYIGYTHKDEQREWLKGIILKAQRYVD